MKNNNKLSLDIQEPKKSGLTSTIFLIVFLSITVLSFIFLPILFSLILFLAILFPILLYISLGKLTKRWGMSLLFTTLIHFVLIIILAIWIYQDTTNLMNNIKTQPKYLLYQENSTVAFASKIDLTSNMNITEISKSEISEIINFINRKDKFVIIIDAKIFNPLNETISIPIQDQNIEVSKQDALAILKSDNSLSIVLKYLTKNNPELSKDLPPELLQQIKDGNISKELEQAMQQTQNQGQVSNKNNLQQLQQTPTSGFDKNSIKPIALTLLLAETAREQGIDYIFDSLNNNNIQIKPDSYITLWIIKHIPFKEIKPYLPQDLTNLNLKTN